MTYQGHIKNGSIVLDEAVPLPDGAEVTVDLIPTEQPFPLSELMKDLISQTTDLPTDGSLQHDHYIYGTPKR